MFLGDLNFISFGPKILIDQGGARVFFWLRPCMYSIYKFEKEDTCEEMINSTIHECAPNVGLVTNQGSNSDTHNPKIISNHQTR